MGVGIADGTVGEFAAAGEGSHDWTLNEAWHDLAASVDAAHPELTIRFTPAANNTALVHGLHLRTAAVGTGSQKARLTLKLNGRSLAPAAEVGAYEDLCCIVPKNALTTGENVLKIVYGGGAAASVAIDKVEIGGSWQLGADNGNNYEFSQEGSGRGENFYVGNRNMANKIRAVTSGWKNAYVHFFMPPELAERAFRFTTRMSDISGAATADNSFRILLNGVEKFSAAHGTFKKGDIVAFDVAAGELLGGWNNLNFQFISSSGYVTFDYYQLAISDYNPATFLFVR